MLVIGSVRLFLKSVIGFLKNDINRQTFHAMHVICKFSILIGLSDQSEEGVFRWLSDSEELTGFSNWEKREPNNQGNQDCVQLWAGKGHQWDDLQCSRNKNKHNAVTAMCQK